MLKNISTFLVCILLVTSFITIIFPLENVKAEGNIFYVGGNGPGNYTTIQSAVDAASANDTVFVYNGIYYENVAVNKTIDIKGENSNLTIINGSGTGNGINITADWVNITGFNIQNCINAILLSNSNHTTITSNHLTNNEGGIYLSVSSNNTLLNNNASYNNFSGIILYISKNNIVLANELSYNNGNGIGLFWSSSNNIIFDNKLLYNSEYGISIYDSSNDNIIYHNIFNNTNNAYDNSNNSWDYGFPTGGNYWDDYTGIDNYQGPNQDIPGSDGIGDTPYQIAGGINQDLYPFMKKYGWLNEPPNTPNNPQPYNHAINIDINADLNWTCSDPDCGDTLIYDIYFGIDNNPPLNKSGYTNTSYDPGTINFNTKYYWKIIAKDSQGSSTTSPIWDFTTVNFNQQPNTPNNPTPQNGTTLINIDQDLYWNGGDPDINDTVTYDVYFGSIKPLEKVANNISATTYDPGNLSNSLTYYWSITAWDNHNNSTNGPEWYFTTIKSTNKPPNKPNKPLGRTSGKIGTTYAYSSSTNDPNNDNIYYLFDWGDGTNSGWDGPYNSGDNVTVAHSWKSIGTYPIKVKAKDIYGNESVWSDPLVISMPKTNINNQIIEIILKILKSFTFFEKILYQIL